MVYTLLKFEPDEINTISLLYESCVLDSGYYIIVSIT